LDSLQHKHLLLDTYFGQRVYSNYFWFSRVKSRSTWLSRPANTWLETFLITSQHLQERRPFMRQIEYEGG